MITQSEGHCESEICCLSQPSTSAWPTGGRQAAVRETTEGATGACGHRWSCPSSCVLTGRASVSHGEGGGPPSARQAWSPSSAVPRKAREETGLGWKPSGAPLEGDSLWRKGLLRDTSQRQSCHPVLTQQQGSGKMTIPSFSVGLSEICAHGIFKRRLPKTWEE